MAVRLVVAISALLASPRSRAHVVGAVVWIVTQVQFLLRVNGYPRSRRLQHPTRRRWRVGHRHRCMGAPEALG
jgi:hypothetical protein